MQKYWATKDRKYALPYCKAPFRASAGAVHSNLESLILESMQWWKREDSALPHGIPDVHSFARFHFTTIDV